jgi:hypothetical protein
MVSPFQPKIFLKKKRWRAWLGFSLKNLAGFKTREVCFVKSRKDFEKNE